MSGDIINDFDRAMLEGSLLPGQIPQMGFTRGVPVSGHQTFAGPGNPLQNNNDARIRNVWKHNLKEEMDTLRRLVDKHPYIAMVRTVICSSCHDRADLTVSGHRIPRNCCSTDRPVHYKGGLPLSDSAVQRRFTESDSAWNYSFQI
jgi:hypothetical protein